MANWKIGDKKQIIHKFTKMDIEQFVSLTGDNNPVHVDEQFIKKTDIGGLAVHGMLAASYISTLIGKKIPGPGAIWSAFNVQWKIPIRIGDSILFEAEVISTFKSTKTLELSITGRNLEKNIVYLEAIAKVMTMEKKNEIKPSTLKGKQVLITGASGTIGGEIAKKLFHEGAKPILWGQDKEKLMRLSKDLKGAKYNSLNLEKPEEIETNLKKLIKSEEVYGLVHVAAPPLNLKLIEELDNHIELEKHLKVGPLAFHKIVQGLIPQMKEGGSIIAILTQNIFNTPPTKTSSYTSAKMATLGIVKSVAAEYGSRGIRCNSVSPSMINTKYTENLPIKIKQIEAANNPLRRLCEPEEVADVVFYLLSPKSSFVNGTNLPITGGVIMN